MRPLKTEELCVVSPPTHHQLMTSEAFEALVKAFAGGSYEPVRIPIREPEMDWKRECFELIAVLRDETQSRAVHARCQAALTYLGSI